MTCLRLYLLRHGETRTEGRNLFNGWTDVDLTDNGRAQLEAAARALAPVRFDRVISSDLYRARYGGELLAKGAGLPHEIQEGFREMNFGHCEGLEFPEIQERFPEVAGNILDPAGGLVTFPGGETDEEFSERVEAAVRKLYSETPDGRVAVVSHSGTGRAVMRALFGFSTKVMWSFYQSHAGLHVIDIFPGWNAVARVVNAYLGPGGYAQEGPGLEFIKGEHWREGA